MDEIRNEEIRRRCGVTDIVEKMREQRLRSLGHVLRREEEEPARVAWDLEVDGARMRGRPKMRWRDRVRKDMDQTGLAIEDAKDRVLGTRRTRTADPRKVWDRADR